MKKLHDDRKQLAQYFARLEGLIWAIERIALVDKNLKDTLIVELTRAARAHINNLCTVLIETAATETLRLDRVEE